MIQWRLYLCLLIPLILCGCTGSRWARRDPDYAEKYAEHTSDPVRVVKQAIDARHVEEKGGTFYGGGYAAFDDAYLGEIGGFGYPYSWLEQRLALSSVTTAEHDASFLGANGGLRVQSPSRLAPFVGVGAYGGVNLIHWIDAGLESALDDPDDNVDLHFDGSSDEYDRRILRHLPGSRPPLLDQHRHSAQRQRKLLDHYRRPQARLPDVQHQHLEARSV